mmetsp:Transcript_14169/g.45209  ORF Transcript_14169/g.45209 Transcript_14169/m.45209 type:complete len:208 (-) Transcript_14169:1149-1772(-)
MGHCCGRHVLRRNRHRRSRRQPTLLVHGVQQHPQGLGGGKTNSGHRPVALLPPPQLFWGAALVVGPRLVRGGCRRCGRPLDCRGGRVQLGDHGGGDIAHRGAYGRGAATEGGLEGVQSGHLGVVAPSPARQGRMRAWGVGLWGCGLWVAKESMHNVHSLPPKWPNACMTRSLYPRHAHVRGAPHSQRCPAVRRRDRGVPSAARPTHT